MGTTTEAARDNRNRYRPNHPVETIEAARSLWNDGHTINEIGRRMQVSRNVVAGISHRNDFTPRPSPIKRRA